MPLPHKANENCGKLEQIHQSGFIIARDHITPFLCELTAKHKFGKREIAAALIILAYSSIRGTTIKAKTPRKDALTLFGAMSNMSIDLIEKHKKPPTFH